MQELTDYMKTYFHLTDESLEMFDEALEKEKEQIKKAYKDGRICIKPLDVMVEEEYYNQTYNQNELPKTYINGVEVDSNNSSVTTTGVWTPKTN